MKILITKNSKIIRTYQCSKQSFKFTLEDAYDYAGGLWDGINKYKVIT